MANPLPLDPPPAAPVAPEIPRHSRTNRLLHWAMALCFLVAMGTGFALYWHILRWTLPLYGGKDSAILLHFWFGLGLGLTTLLVYLVWRTLARWTPADTHFVKHLRKYAASPDQVPPPETGFFNGGQKLYFWSVVVSTALLVVTGVVFARMFLTTSMPFAARPIAFSRWSCRSRCWFTSIRQQSASRARFVPWSAAP